MNLCVNLAYDDKLPKGNMAVKFLVVRQDLFGRTVDAKGIKTKDCRETLRAVKTMITKKHQLEQIWVNKSSVQTRI